MYAIRPATDTDIPRLATIFRNGRVQAFHWCDPSDFQLSDFTVQTEGEIVHVATDFSDTPIAFISIWQQDSFIHHLFVEPDHQRKGVGTLLLASLSGWLPLPYRLKCLIDNTPARIFYEKSGWKDISFGEDALGKYALMELTIAESSTNSTDSKGLL